MPNCSLNCGGAGFNGFRFAGTGSLETLVRARYEHAIRPLDGNGRRWRGLLRAIYLKQGRADAYERIAAEAGYPADDCLALARLHSGDDAVLALRWVERGLAAAEKTPYAAGPYALVPMRRELLARLGREDEALASAWEDFLRRSTTDALEELLQYAPAGEREAWRERALESAQGPVREKLELLAGTGDTVRIAAVTEAASDAELEGISHFLTEPAATMLEPERPFLAGRLWRAQALRILNAGKSRYYDAALDNLERARDCFRRAGREAEWEKTVMELSRAHARKQGFSRGLAAVARGESRVRPSFLETAMAKWTKRDGQ